MATKTPGRYALKAIMSGFLLAIVTVFMLAIKTQFAGTNEGLVNLLGAIAFSLALVLIVLTNSELLTSNFMYLTVIYGIIKPLLLIRCCSFSYSVLWEYYRWIHIILLNERDAYYDARNDCDLSKTVHIENGRINLVKYFS